MPSSHPDSTESDALGIHDSPPLGILRDAGGNRTLVRLHGQGTWILLIGTAFGRSARRLLKVAQHDDLPQFDCKSVILQTGRFAGPNRAVTRNRPQGRNSPPTSTNASTSHRCTSTEDFEQVDASRAPAPEPPDR